MFKEWDFLLAEIWVLLALAGLIGLIAGWLIFGGRRGADIDMGADANEVRRLRSELDRANAKTRAMAADPLNDIPAMEGGGYVRPSKVVAPVPQTPTPILTPEPAVQTPVAAPVQLAPDAIPTPQPIQTSTTPSTKPTGISAPRDGLPDDLTKIKGIGAKMEKLCNSLGFWHYDQIAVWTADEIAWVDDNLEGFKGRVTRDDWVAQATAMAGSSTAAFVRRKD